ncbi:hypothetical protein [Brevibacterium spongiae]|uniref:Cobalamin-independent methionine synthase MetE C-terminal/archaeal domain-containing protein n=1 Tax=Brevibacterium spongiae TaxID=2909672 RepID=A0ABY5SKA2_9MICO|nr:hypothetical protein [Brevibacterium spongiae]UVI34967.1 hypothetical protein L1F31_12645 [Brevibacterium spongiae]
MSTSSESRAATEPAPDAPTTVLPAATTTGIWLPGARDPHRSYIATSPVREAAAAGFDILADQLPPVPLTAHASEGRWGADAIGRAVGLLTDLHVDRTSYGWRLTASAGKDERLEDSALVEAFDAIAEYGQSRPGQVQISLPGPWTLVTALSLSSGARVLGDHGARRDVVQAYAFGIAAFTDRIAGLGMQPTVRLVESRLTPVLTGTWPTVSGWASLPAISETQVWAALESTLRHLPPTVLALPNLDPLHLQGKAIPAVEAVQRTGAHAVSVPWASLKAQNWEQAAILAEAGLGVWFHLPSDAGTRPDAVNHWVDRIRTPWSRIGMGAASLRDIGIIAGPELPLSHPPLLDEKHELSPEHNRGTMTIAAGLRRALEEIE